MTLLLSYLKKKVYWFPIEDISIVAFHCFGDKVETHYHGLYFWKKNSMFKKIKIQIVEISVTFKTYIHTGPLNRDDTYYITTAITV